MAKKKINPILINHLRHLRFLRNQLSSIYHYHLFINIINYQQDLIFNIL